MAHHPVTPAAATATQVEQLWAFPRKPQQLKALERSFSALFESYRDSALPKWMRDKCAECINVYFAIGARLTQGSSAEKQQVWGQIYTEIIGLARGCAKYRSAPPEFAAAVNDLVQFARGFSFDAQPTPEDLISTANPANESEGAVEQGSTSTMPPSIKGPNGEVTKRKGKVSQKRAGLKGIPAYLEPPEALEFRALALMDGMGVNDYLAKLAREKIKANPARVKEGLERLEAGERAPVRTKRMELEEDKQRMTTALLRAGIIPH